MELPNGQEDVLLDWFKPDQRETRQKIRLDRKHLERRSRRFLENYIVADEALKARYYQCVQEASMRCRPDDTGAHSEFENVDDADATATAAVQAVKWLEEKMAEDGFDLGFDFLIDAYATVGVGYRRAAGVYVKNNQMQALGTAAVHLLTMATSYEMSQGKVD